MKDRIYVLSGMEKDGPEPHPDKNLGFHLGVIDDPLKSAGRFCIRKMPPPSLPGG